MLSKVSLEAFHQNSTIPKLFKDKPLDRKWTTGMLQQ
jgi:hypothetical protein